MRLFDSYPLAYAYIQSCKIQKLLHNYAAQAPTAARKRMRHLRLRSRLQLRFRNTAGQAQRGKRVNIERKIFNTYNMFNELRKNKTKILVLNFGPLNFCYDYLT
jgi:hypothetical protein